MVQSIEDLREMVMSVVKVKQTTDPTKTQGARLRQLLTNILDTVQDLVERLGLSVSDDLSETTESMSDLSQILRALEAQVQDYINGMPSVDNIALVSQLPDLTPYLKALDAFDGDYNSLRNKPNLNIYQLTTDSISYTRLINTPTLFNGDYNSLNNKPVLFDGAWTSITNKPAFFDGSYLSLSNKPVLFSGSYSDLSNKPTLVTSYTQLTDKPTIPNAQVNSDWTATTGVSVILNKPVLVTSYDQLTNKPTIFSGSYTDLANKPTIPAAQVQTDWSLTSGIGSILNKPVLFDGTYGSLTGKPSLFNGSYTSLTNIPTTFTPSAHTHIIGDITGLQSALNGIPLNKRTFTTTGELTSQVIREWVAVITATGSGQTVDITNAGFSTILGIQTSVEVNSTNPLVIPQVSVKSWTLTQLVLNFLVSNSTTVNLLGAIVTGLQLASTVTGVKVHITVKGY